MERNAIELPHTHDHGSAPIVPGTPIPLRALCGVGDPDTFGGFIQYHEVTGPVKMLKKGIDPMKVDLEEDDCEERIETRAVHRHVNTLSEAHGIWFDCPKCWQANGGPVGTHGVCVWFRGSPVPDSTGLNAQGQPVRWQVVSGSGLDDLVLAPSILLQGGCGWHGFVGNNGVPPGHAT